MRHLSALIVLAIAALAAATPPPPDAATLYREAFAWWSAAIAGESAVLSSAEQIAIVEPVVGAPTAAQRSAYAKLAPYLDRIRTASALPDCAWGIDTSAGFSTLLPHLSQLRTAARSLRFDAEMRVASGDVDGAIGSLSSLAGIAQHSRGEGFLVSSLVSGAVAMVQERGIDQLLGSTLVTPADAERLLASLGRYDPKDPMGLLHSMAQERDVARATLERAFSGDEGADESDGILDPETDERLRGLDADNWLEELDRTDSAYAAFERVVAMENRDEARAEMARLSASIEAGEFGPLARMLMPALDRSMESNWRLADAIAARRADLARVRDGAIDSATLTNAAFAYLRASSIAAALPEEAKATIEGARFAWEAMDDDAREAALAAIEPLRERLEREFRFAGRAGRCAFDLAIAQGPVYLSSYLPGLRAAIRVLLADALLAPTTLSYAPRFAPGDAIAAAIVAAGHLAADPRIGHSLVAASVLAEAADAIEALDRAKRLDDATRERLRTLVAALPRDDMLGVRAAIAKDRERLLQRVPTGAWRDGLTLVLDRRGADALTGWLLLQQLVDERGVEVSDGAADGHLPRRWTADTLARPLVGAADLVDRRTLDAMPATLGAYRSLGDARSSEEPSVETWSKRFAALGVEPAIDLSLRALAVGPLLSRLDDLLDS
jgi:tetratricopeptide (TPR) repeat protein